MTPVQAQPAVSSKSSSEHAIIAEDTSGVVSINSVRYYQELGRARIIVAWESLHFAMATLGGALAMPSCLPGLGPAISSTISQPYKSIEAPAGWALQFHRRCQGLNPAVSLGCHEPELSNALTLLGGCLSPPLRLKSSPKRLGGYRYTQPCTDAWNAVQSSCTINFR